MKPTYVGCRELEGALGEIGQHCAIRIVDEEGNEEMYELLNVDGVNQVGRRATAEEMAKYDPSAWTLVDVPEGMSGHQFDALVGANARSIGQARNGNQYTPLGGANSNRYVFDVITSSGGSVPYGALLGGFRFAPGICGGSGLRIGQQCSGR